MEKEVIKKRNETTGFRTLSSYEIGRGLLYFGKAISDMSSEVDVYCSDGKNLEKVQHGEGTNSGYLFIKKGFFEKRPWLKEGDQLNYIVRDNSTIEIELPSLDVEEVTKECELNDAFESEVQDFLVSHITALGNDLQLYQGIRGKEFPAEGVGRIDLLCIDKSGNFVVVELKKTMPSDKVVGQISRYMGWVKKNLANGKEVRGIIVAPQSETENIKLNYAVSANPSIQLRYYKISMEIL